MPTYQNINLRINMDSEEALIWNNLNPNNRSGNAKNILLSIFRGVEIQEIRKEYIEATIKSILKSLDFKVDIRGTYKIDQLNHIDENYLMESISSIMKGVTQ